MVSTQTIGTLVMILAGVLATNSFVLSKFLKEWPYFQLLGTSALINTLGSSLSVAVMQKPSLGLHQIKWVVLRGFCGAGNFVTAVIAVRQTPLGDVATFGSINMVMAAFLGRAFLGEALRPLHFLGLACSLVGAVLISQPTFIFGASDSAESSRWVGYALALLSGFFSACVYICARKSASVSAWIHLCSTMLQVGLASWLVPFLPFVKSKSLDIVVQSPWAAFGWLALVGASSFFSGASSCIGARWCPAAVSATVNTTSRMVCSYVAQALIFGEPVEALTLMGAGSMLASVVIMAAAGKRRNTAAATNVEEAPDAQPAEEPSIVEEEAETESLASFIAAEFVDGSHNDKALRQRRGSTEPAVQQIGAVAAMASVAI